jgi:hypothetical protein
MQRFLLLISLILFVATPSSAKVKPWSNGSVVLLSGDTLACQLRFTRKVKEGLLQILKEGKIEQILTVKQVRSFEYWDEAKKKTRYFNTLSLQPELSGKKHEVFMEVMYADQYFSIVNHRTLGYSDNTWQVNPFRKKQVVDNAYLLENATGSVLPLSKENLLKMAGDKQAQLEIFLKKFRALKSLTDYMEVLEYHQALL